MSRRPLGIAAVTVAGLEAALAAAGVQASLLSAVLLVAPGFALAPLLPEPLRRSPVAALAAAPVLGVAASSIVLISASSASIPLTGTAVRLILGTTIVLAVALLPGPDVGGRLDRGARLGALGLGAAVVAGVVLEGRVLHGSPAPGNDWAKYVLYADEIRRHHALLIDNPYWMLGVPFREDPGAPALYGSFLVLSGQSASTVMHGIWGFAVLSVLSTYAYVRSLWGEVSGVLAAAFVAVIPVSHDILGWHGLANLAALCQLPLVLLYLTLLVTRGLDWRGAGGFGVLLVGVAAAHRLSLLVTVATVAATLAVALVLSAEARRRMPRDALKVAVLVALISPGVVYDLVTRGRSFGGTLSYRSYLSSKVDLSLAASDLTWLFCALAVAALLLAAAWGAGAHAQGAGDPWPAATQTSKPWMRWWWPGSAVDREHITAQLEAFAAAGIGGVEITPIYGAKGAEARYIDFLSDRWLALLAHTGKEARRLGLGVDMATGTGWPFGGPGVQPAHGSSSLVLIDGQLAGKPTGMKVKRAAPGGQGLVLDPYSTAALDEYLQPFTAAFAKLPRDSLRSQFHDSFEYYDSSWSPALEARFREMHGYDIQQYAAEIEDDRIDRHLTVS